MRPFLSILLGLLLALSTGCGTDAADDAFREIVGAWQLDPKASFDATMDGNLVASFLPRDELAAAFDGSDRWPRLRLQVGRDGKVVLDNRDHDHAATGTIEDTGQVFLARFAHADQDQMQALDGLARVTFELDRRGDRLHARIVGSDADGATPAELDFLRQMGILAWARLVFRAPD